jgi:hypothetical protein
MKLMAEVMDIQKESYSIRPSRWVSILAIMTSLALVGNYTLVTIPNVELGSVILFVTAFLFGARMGLWSTLLMSVVYGSINPWGGFIPQIWFSQVVGWLFIVSVGALMGVKGPRLNRSATNALELGLVGAIVTLMFDLTTNLGYSWAFGVPYDAALVAGFPFLVLHVFSNALIFAAIVPRIESTVRLHLATQIWDVEIKNTQSWSEE